MKNKPKEVMESSATTPKSLYTFTEIVQRILQDAQFAQTIHGLAYDAARDDAAGDAAKETLARYFSLSPDELKMLNLKDRESLIVNKCTVPTRVYLVDFACMLAAKKAGDAGVGG